MAQTILCPYCGIAEDARSERCGACGGFFDDLSRRVTQQHMGPWFVRDPQQPFRPGCTYEILVKQIQRGKITELTPLRGPTTRQFWTTARKVPGVAHLLGFCHACGASTKADAKQCANCSAAFGEPSERDALGLAPVDPGLGEEVEKARAAEAAALAAAAAAAPPPVTSKPASSTGMPAAAPLRAAGASGTAGVASPVATQARRSGTRPPSASGIPRSAAPAVATVKSSSGIQLPGDMATVRAAASATPGGAARATVLNTSTGAAPSSSPRSAALGGARGEALPWMTGNAASPQPAAEAKPAGMNKWVIAFISLNALLVVALVLIILNQTMSSTPNTESPAANQPVKPKPAAPAEAQPAPTPPPAAIIEPQPKPLPEPAAPVTPVAPAPVTPTVVAPPTPPAPIAAPAPPPVAGGASFFGITVNPSGITDEQAALLNEQLAKADELYKADKLDEAKAILIKIKSQLGAAAKAAGIDDAIKTVTDKIHKRELDQFFNPTPPK